MKQVVEYIPLSCKQKLSGGVDNVWLNCKVTTFDGCFNLHFIHHPDIAQKSEDKLDISLNPIVLVSKTDSFSWL